MRRGEVWWADLPAPIGRRPVLLLSRDEAYAVRGRVTIAPVTTTVRHLPTEVPLGPRDGLKQPSVASLDDLTTIAKGHLSDRISVLSPTKMRAVRAALIFALALDE